MALRWPTSADAQEQAPEQPEEPQDPQRTARENSPLPPSPSARTSGPASGEATGSRTVNDLARVGGAARPTAAIGASLA